MIGPIDSLRRVEGPGLVLLVFLRLFLRSLFIIAHHIFEGVIILEQHRVRNGGRGKGAVVKKDRRREDRAVGFPLRHAMPPTLLTLEWTPKISRVIAMRHVTRGHKATRPGGNTLTNRRGLKRCGYWCWLSNWAGRWPQTVSFKRQCLLSRLTYTAVLTFTFSSKTDTIRLAITAHSGRTRHSGRARH